jgi:hypothetical protein
MNDDAARDERLRQRLVANNTSKKWQQYWLFLRFSIPYYFENATNSAQTSQNILPQQLLIDLLNTLLRADRIIIPQPLIIFMHILPLPGS